MTLKNAISHFNRMVSESTKKSEIKVYEDFIHILTELEKRTFKDSELQSLEKELGSLDLAGSTANRKRHLKRALGRFKDYLKDDLSLVVKGHYTNLFTVLGISMGLSVGIVFLSGLEPSVGISLGITVGVTIGLLIASYLDSRAKASGNLI